MKEKKEGIQQFRLSKKQEEEAKNIRAIMQKKEQINKSLNVRGKKERKSSVAERGCDLNYNQEGWVHVS